MPTCFGLQMGDTWREIKIFPGQTHELELLLDPTTAGLPYDQCVGASYQRLHEDPDGAIADIVDRFQHVADQCDAVLIVGSDYTDVASPSELSVNARIAVNLGADQLAQPASLRLS